MWNLNKQNLTEKEIRLVVTRGGGWEVGGRELEEGDKKVQTSSHTISNRDVMYMMTIANTAL